MAVSPLAGEFGSVGELADVAEVLESAKEYAEQGLDLVDSLEWGELDGRIDARVGREEGPKAYPCLCLPGTENQRGYQGATREHLSCNGSGGNAIPSGLGPAARAQAAVRVDTNNGASTRAVPTRLRLCPTHTLTVEGSTGRDSPSRTSVTANNKAKRMPATAAGARRRQLMQL